jgi:hypothetical protein
MTPEKSNFVPAKKACRPLLLILLLLLYGLATTQTVENQQTPVPLNAGPAEGNLDLIIIAFPEPGWYQVSLPVVVENDSVRALFPTATSAFAWEKDHYEAADTMAIGRGYFLFIPEPAAAIISGTAITQFSGHFTAGWQMLGSVIDTVDFSDPNDTPDGSILLPAFSWFGFQPRYNPPITTLEQSFGHWIAVLQETDLTIQSNPASSPDRQMSLTELRAHYDQAGLSAFFQRDIETIAKIPGRSMSFIQLRPASFSRHEKKNALLAKPSQSAQPFGLGQTRLSQAQWTIPMTVALTGQGQDMIAFGAMAGATNGLDPGIDLLNPPAPPTVFDAFFQIVHPIFPNLTEDFRADTITAAIWNLRIIDTGGATGTIAWEVSGFPTAQFSNSRLEIRREDAVLADMLAVDSLNYTGDQNLSIVLFPIRDTRDTLACQAIIISPKDGALICENSVKVSGVVRITNGVPPFTRECKVNGVVASISDSLFMATVPLKSGNILIVATCTIIDSQGKQAVCRDSINVLRDIRSPSCSFTQRGPVVTGKFTDKESGIATIVPINLGNAKLTVDPFTPGDQLVRFRMDAIDPDQALGFNIEITDRCGNTFLCDPILLSLSADDHHRQRAFTFPSMDRYFQLANDGLSEIRVELNGNRFQLFSDPIRAEQEINAYPIPLEGGVTIDMQPYLHEGENTMLIAFAGHPGTGADLMLIDSVDTVDYILKLQTIPVAFRLAQNYPNPFNPTTNIRFDIPDRMADGAVVRLRIYNVLGEWVRTLVDEMKLPGQYVAQWDGTNAQGTPESAGIYIYRIEAADFKETKRMIMLK